MDGKSRPFTLVVSWKSTSGFQCQQEELHNVGKCSLVESVKLSKVVKLMVATSEQR